MTLREELAEKKAALSALKERIENDDAEAIEQGAALQAEIETKSAELEAAEKKAALLETIGEKSEKTTEEKKMTELEMFAKSASEMTDRKSGVSAHIKAATDVVTSPQIADVDRSVAPQPRRRAIADYFTNTQISGNAITYFLQGAYEGTPAVTAQSAKKPANSTSFTGTTLALSKIAAYIKETDEILYDAPFLASEVENSLVYQVGKIEDATVVGSILGTSGLAVATYDTSLTPPEGLAEGILKAILAIKGGSAYDASVVLVNPADLYGLLSARDSNGQYLGGGYFTGAYGNGNYAMPATIWGVPVVADSTITQGTALVAAREAVKIWKKGGIDVRLFEQNEDDAIYNRVTLVGEERLACAVVDLKGVFAVASEES